jgi:ABC-type multidrug transport system, ATPase and permease components
MEKNQTKKSSILRFFPFTRGFRLRFLIALVSVLLAVVMSYMTPQVIRVTVDSVLNDLPFQLPQFMVSFIDSMGGRDFLRQNIVVCAIASAVFAILSGVFSYVSRRSLAIACEGTAAKTRETLFEHIQKLPFAWHNTHQTGDIIQRCTQDVNLIRNFIADQMLEVIRTILLIVVSLALMFSMNLRLSLVVSAFMPVLIASNLIFFVLTAKRFQFADETEGALTSVVQENLTGVRVVRAFGRERFEIDHFTEKNEEFTDLWIKLGKILSLNWSSGDLMAGAQVLVVTIVGVFFVSEGTLTAGEFLAFIAYNSMIVWPARNLGRLLGELSKTSISSTRLFEILDSEQEHDCENPKKPDINGDIVFENVNFGYPGSSEVLHDISFTIKKGTTFGILGATGSGKSTLMYLLDRLYELPPENGKITISGVDIREIELHHLRENIGIVLQEPFLFSKSFRESIAEGAKSTDLTLVRKYAKLAVIDDAISGFTEGYETQIGERGVTISGGQKQRVAIARMLMQDTPIKVFDDSLSAVDMETDAKIRKSINENVHGTTILIAHRITTLMNADCILVLDKGGVSQIGTHNELIQTDGIYKRIYDAQKLNSEESA